MDTAERRIKLAEGRLRIAESPGLGIAGKVARTDTGRESDAMDVACEHLEARDEFINERRPQGSGEGAA